MKTKKKKTDLPALIQANDGVAKALAALLRGLNSKKAFVQNGKVVECEDNATHVRAAETILGFVSSKPKPSVPKDEPTARLSDSEREAEVRRILGIE